MPICKRSVPIKYNFWQHWRRWSAHGYVVHRSVMDFWTDLYSKEEYTAFQLSLLRQFPQFQRNTCLQQKLDTTILSMGLSLSRNYMNMNIPHEQLYRVCLSTSVRGWNNSVRNWMLLLFVYKSTNVRQTIWTDSKPRDVRSITHQSKNFETRFNITLGRLNFPLKTNINKQGLFLNTPTNHDVFCYK